MIELTPFEANAKPDQKVKTEVATEKLSSEAHKISNDQMPIIFEHKSILKDHKDNRNNEKLQTSQLPLSGLEKNTISLLARRISKQIADSVSPIRELINRTKKRNDKYRSISKRNNQIELQSTANYQSVRYDAARLCF